MQIRIECVRVAIFHSRCTILARIWMYERHQQTFECTKNRMINHTHTQREEWNKKRKKNKTKLKSNYEIQTAELLWTPIIICCISYCNAIIVDQFLLIPFESIVIHTWIEMWLHFLVTVFGWRTPFPNLQNSMWWTISQIISWATV